MNDQHLVNKVSQDAAKVKKDLNTLVEDGASQLSKGYEKLKGDTRKKVVGAAETVKKDVGDGLSQYNTKAQEVADKVPYGFSEMVARYPWVAISTALVVGFLLGGLLKPGRKFLK